MKKFLIIGLIVMMVTFFTLPALAFAETPVEPDPDIYTYSGVDDGQMTMDLTNDNNCEPIPDTDVLCIDPGTLPNDDPNAYTDTGDFVSEVLAGELNNGGVIITDEQAAAVEIIAISATGATDSDNQAAVEDIIEGDTPPAGSDVEKIVDAAEGIAADYVDAKELDDSLTVPEFLDDENVNELVVTLDDDPLVDPISLDTNTFEATAIMENPLVPEVTDQNKVTYWYLLEGSYNVSFSPTDLVTETTSIMNDVKDDADEVILTDATDEKTIDNDGDGTITDDSYGLATVPYFFYWWGAGFPQYEEMQVNMFAWVDIDEDTKLDITDLPGDKNITDTTDPNYKDGDVVGQFMKDYQVIMTQDNPDDPLNPVPGDHVIINTAALGDDPIVKTEPVLSDALETTEVKTCTNGMWLTGWYWWCWHNGSPHSGNVSIKWDNPEYKVTTYVNEFDVCEAVGGIVLEGLPNEVKELNTNITCNHGNWGYDCKWDCDGHTTITKCSKDGIYSNNWLGLCFNGCWSGSGTNRHWHCNGHSTCTKCSDDGKPKYIYREVDSQRFVIENYSEPFDGAEGTYSAWGAIVLTKTDFNTGAPVPGAVYRITFLGIPGPDNYKDIATDEYGEIIVKGLYWGDYTIQEMSAPGYNIDPAVYTRHIGGNALFADLQITSNKLIDLFPVQDVPIITGGGGVPPVIKVEALTEEVVEVKGISAGGDIKVAGITELPFTGSNPMFALIGILMLAAGLASLIVVRKQFAK